VPGVCSDGGGKQLIRDWAGIKLSGSCREIDERKVKLHGSDAGVVMRHGSSGRHVRCFFCATLINAGISGYFGRS
jgi:hypothetical protein